MSDSTFDTLTQRLDRLEREPSSTARIHGE